MSTTTCFSCGEIRNILVLFGWKRKAPYLELCSTFQYLDRPANKTTFRQFQKWLNLPKTCIIWGMFSINWATLLDEQRYSDHSTHPHSQIRALTFVRLRNPYSLKAQLAKSEGPETSNFFIIENKISCLTLKWSNIPAWCYKIVVHFTFALKVMNTRLFRLMQKYETLHKKIMDKNKCSGAGNRTRAAWVKSRNPNH